MGVVLLWLTDLLIIVGAPFFVLTLYMLETPHGHDVVHMRDLGHIFALSFDIMLLMIALVLLFDAGLRLYRRRIALSE